MLLLNFLPRFAVVSTRQTIRIRIPAELAQQALLVVAVSGQIVTVGKLAPNEASVELSFPRSGPRITQVYLVTPELKKIRLQTCLTWVIRADRSVPARAPFKGLERIRRRPWKSPQELGVNYYGPIGAISGVGNSTRNYILALQKALVPVVGCNTCPPAPLCTFPVFPARIKPRYTTNIIYSNPEHLPELFMKIHPQALHGRKTIVTAAWELEEVPPAWKQFEPFFDEIWAISEFSARAFRQAFNKPAHAVPSCIGVLKSHLVYQRAHFGVPAQAYVYLYIFDVGSIFERKNPLALIQAFQETFGESKEVHLIVKAGMPDRDPANMRLLREMIAGFRNIQLLEQMLSESELYSLINAADCYVSPHRTEGFGLTPAEALALGKPVIATDYGATQDFLNQETGYPIAFQRVELDRDYGPYWKGCHWADISLSELGNALRHVRNYPEEARAKALRGQQVILENFSHDSIGRRMRKLLES